MVEMYSWMHLRDAYQLAEHALAEAVVKVVERSQFEKRECTRWDEYMYEVELGRRPVVDSDDEDPVLTLGQLHGAMDKTEDAHCWQMWRREACDKAKAAYLAKMAESYPEHPPG